MPDPARKGNGMRFAASVAGLTAAFLLYEEWRTHPGDRDHYHLAFFAISALFCRNEEDETSFCSTA